MDYMQKKLILTGFEPFGGEAVNPAWEAVKRLEGEIGPYRVHAIEIPTVFGAAARAVLEYGLRLVEANDFEQRLRALEERSRK